MNETAFISTRLTLTKQERLISKSWGSWWNYFGRMERSNGYFNVLFGNWSGYTSSQSRITHIDWCPKALDESYHGTVKFTDNTTMNVWVERLTRKDIIRRGLRRNTSYEILIHKLLSFGNNYYDVAKKKLKKPMTDIQDINTEEKNCAFQYAEMRNGLFRGNTVIIEDKTSLTINEAKDLWNKYYSRAAKHIYDGGEVEMVIWINMIDNNSYGNSLEYISTDAESNGIDIWETKKTYFPRKFT